MARGSGAGYLFADPNMRLIWITRRFHAAERPSGPVSMLLALLPALARSGAEVEVLCARRPGQPVQSDVAGVRVLALPEWNPAAFARHLRAYDPTHAFVSSTFHAAPAMLAWCAPFAALARGVPRSFVQLTHPGPLHPRRIVGPWLRSFDRVFVTGDAMVRRFRAELRVEATLLRPGIDLSALPERGGAALRGRVGFMGHMSLVKGVDRFVDLARRVPDAEFRLAADRSPRAVDAILAAEVEHAARSVPNLRLLGRVAEPLTEMATWDALVLPYREGTTVLGTARAAIEAMALGIPVLATPNDATEGIVEDGVNGYVCPDVASMAARLEVLRRDAALRSRLSRAARRTAEARFDVDRIAEALIRDIEGGPPRHAE